jgi:hypothetical protein
MLTAIVLGPEGDHLGVLGKDFIFRPEISCIVQSIGFYRHGKQLFRTDLDSPRACTVDDEVRVNLDSGIGFYFLATILQEPFTSVEDMMNVWRSLRRLVEKIIHEREARNEFGTWDKQIYEVLFHEEQQPVPWGDSGLLVQRDHKRYMG